MIIIITDRQRQSSQQSVLLNSKCCFIFPPGPIKVIRVAALTALAACLCGISAPDVGEGSRDRNSALLLISDSGLVSGAPALSGCAGGNLKNNSEMYTLFRV